MNRRDFLRALGAGAAAVAAGPAIQLVEREPVRRYWQVPSNAPVRSRSPYDGWIGLSGWIPDTSPTEGEVFFGVDRSVNGRIQLAEDWVETGLIDERDALALLELPRRAGMTEQVMTDFRTAVVEVLKPSSPTVTITGIDYDAAHRPTEKG